MLGSQSTYLVSQIFLAVGNWLLLASIANNFDLEATGAYNLALAIQTPVFLLFSLQLRNHYLSMDRSAESHFVSYLYLRFLALLPAIFFCALGAWLLDAMGPFFWGVLVLKSSELVFELPFMVEHRYERLGKASLIHILRSLVIYGLLALCLWRGEEVFFSFALASLISLAMSFGYLRYILRSGPLSEISKSRDFWSLRAKDFKRLISDGLHLGSSAAILSFNISLARFFISHFKGKDELAIYSVSFAFYGVWQLVFNSYLNSALPKFRNIDLFDLVKLPLGLFGAFSVIFLAFDEFIYSALFGANYTAAKNLSPYLLISILLSFFSSLLYYSFMAKGDFKSHFKIGTLSFCVNLFLLYPCLYLFDLSGAYISWSASLLTLCIFYKATSGKATSGKRI